MVWTIYHNPHCSKSRDSLALLRQHGIEPTVVRYLETPPTVAALKQLLHELALPVSAIIRNTDAGFQDSDLADPTLSTDAQLAVLAAQPRWLQRPIISNGQRAVLGRPPENLLALL